MHYVPTMSRKPKRNARSPRAAAKKKPPNAKKEVVRRYAAPSKTKVSIAVSPEEIAWVNQYAQHRRQSVSGVYAEALELLRQRQAAQRVLEVTGGEPIPIDLQVEIYREQLEALEETRKRVAAALENPDGPMFIGPPYRHVELE